jgi:hypothetical protein
VHIENKDAIRSFLHGHVQLKQGEMIENYYRRVVPTVTAFVQRSEIRVLHEEGKKRSSLNATVLLRNNLF